MAAFDSVISTLLAEPATALAGTDISFSLPLTRVLLNEALAARPAHIPIQELLIDPNDRNRFRVHLRANAPVVGTVSRQILFAPGMPVSFPDQPWLDFCIEDGLGFLDRSLISVLQGVIEKKLPRGVELSSKRLRIHIPALLTDLGYQQLVPLIHQLEIKSEANRLIVNLHLKAQ